MAKILHTIYNTSPTLSAVVNSFTFVTDAAIRHSADLAAFAGLTDNYLGATTLVTLSTNYVTGGLSRKPFASATFPVTQTITGHNGTTLVVDSTAALTDKIGWQGNGVYLGRYIVSITSATYLLMSNTPSSAPTIPSTITFSTSTNELTLSGTTPTLGMASGWKILGNGYNSTGTVISVKNSFTLIVDNLPDTTPTVGNPMTFRAPGTDGSKTVTVASSAGLSNGFIASGNGFTIGQSITNVSGNVLTMSAEPNGTPEFGGSISFANSNATLYTIPPSGSVSFNLDYSNISGTTGHPGTPYASILTIKVTQSTQRSLVVRNYVSIDAIPVPPPPDTYTGNYGSSGGRGGDSGFGSAPAPSVGHRGLSDGNQSISGSQNGSFGNGSVGTGGQSPGGFGNSGVGTACIVPWALVTMADGSFKQMQFVKEGDLIQGVNNANVVIENLAIKATSRIVSFNNIGYFATETHPFMTNKGWGCFNPDLLKLGNSEYYQQLKDDNNNKDLVAINENNLLYTFIDGKEEQLSIDNILYQSNENFIVYKMKVSGDRTFIVENIVSHNK